MQKKNALEIILAQKFLIFECDAICAQISLKFRQTQR